MAWAGYSCFTPDFALIKEDLLCSTPVWKEWEHLSVPEAAGEHPPARATCQQNKSLPQPWTGQLKQIRARSEINLAAAICAEASPTGAAAERQKLPIMLIPPGCQAYEATHGAGSAKGMVVCRVLPTVNLTAPEGQHRQSASVSPFSAVVEFALVLYCSPMYSFRGGLSAHISG